MAIFDDLAARVRTWLYLDALRAVVRPQPHRLARTFIALFRKAAGIIVSHFFSISAYLFKENIFIVSHTLLYLLHLLDGGLECRWILVDQELLVMVVLQLVMVMLRVGLLAAVGLGAQVRDAGHVLVFHLVQLALREALMPCGIRGYGST